MATGEGRSQLLAQEVLAARAYPIDPSLVVTNINTQFPKFGAFLANLLGRQTSLDTRRRLCLLNPKTAQTLANSR